MSVSADSSYAIIVVRDNVSTWVFGPCNRATGKWRVWYYQVAPGEGYRRVKHAHKGNCFPDTYFAEVWSTRFTVRHQQIDPSTSLQEAMLDVITEETM